MFRQEELFFGGWQDKTMESMQRRRFDQEISRLGPLGSARLEALEAGGLRRKLERCWQDIEKKPLRSQQIAQVWKSVLSSIELQADCLSQEEHELVERAIVLGGSARIEDAVELEAARALSLRLWASVGLVSGKPYIELERPVRQAAARAFARPEHDAVRRRLERFNACLKGMLYRMGAMDDRMPQQQFIREVLQERSNDELFIQLSRRYLWAGFDCVDYSGGVMLVHPAVAEPYTLIHANSRRAAAWSSPLRDADMRLDILPEEIPLQRELELAISGALREGCREAEVARTLRLLCKQGAPLSALEEMLQESLIVYLSSSMRGALMNMYYRIPKWMESSEPSALQ